MSINELIMNLKENNQDFEFYPTTKEMIKTIYNVSEGGEWLDIGCGTCNFKKYFNELGDEDNSDNSKRITKYYVIEKSKILLDKLDKDTICLGTDFNNTVLIDKPVINIFCNPPYSQYEEWTVRLIFEANCKNIYLIIPERWKNNERITKAIESRAVCNVIGNFDFLDAERTARAKVDILKITKKDKWGRTCYTHNLDGYNQNAFDEWFDTTFKMRDNKDLDHWQVEETKRNQVKNKLVDIDESKAKILVDLYNEEIETLFNHFKTIAGLDVDILATIGISKSAVKEALQKKATGAKVRYWKLAMDELEEITDRLTSSTRQEMFNKFAIIQKVDFTLENIYPFLLWVLKNSSDYYNKQLVDFFKSLSTPDNVILFKSNQKVFKRCEWRHNSFAEPEKISHYTLDYRIIMSSPFKIDYYGRLEKNCCNPEIIFQDIFTIAKNLGFEVGAFDLPNNFGEECTILYKNSDKVFAKYRAYKNGNMHIKFDIEFAKAMNVEVSRLLGWIKEPADIQKEFSPEMTDGAEKYYKRNYTCIGSNQLLLTKK